MSKVQTWLSRQTEYYRRLSTELSGTRLDAEDWARLVIGAVCAADHENLENLLLPVPPKFRFLRPLVAAPAMTLRDWAKQEGVPILSVYQEEITDLPATTPYSRSFQYSAEATFFCTIEDAAWVPGWDYVIAPDGTVLSDTGYRPLTISIKEMSHVYSDGAVAHYQPAEEIYVPEAIYMSAPVQNVGHWLIDFLPRLYAQNFAPEAKVIVPQNMSVRQFETFAAFGIGQDRLIVAPLFASTYRFGKLHVYFPGRSMPPRRQHVQYVRKALSKAVDKPTPGRRVFVSRGDVNTRLISNDAEFRSFLMKERFVTIDPAQLSLSEQQLVLADAEVMLGTFGSQMLSLYMAPAGSKVIILTHDPAIDPTIAPTCAILGIKHQDLTCAPVAGRARFAKDKDVLVDIAELTSRL